MATYLILNLVVVGFLIGVRALWHVRLGRRWAGALIALLVLTLIFDNIIVGLGIVTYNPARFLGVRLGAAPIEDFAYAIAASLLIELLWQRGSRT